LLKGKRSQEMLQFIEVHAGYPSTITNQSSRARSLNAIHRSFIYYSPQSKVPT
jgi:hypothetical protein